MLLYSKYVWKLLLVIVKSHIAGVKLINVLTFDFGIFACKVKYIIYMKLDLTHARWGQIRKAQSSV